MLGRLTVRVVLSLAVFSAVSFSVAHAQTGTTGAVSGTVTDSSGAVVAGASVNLIEPATNQTLATKTNAEGQYTFPAVAPSEYRIAVSAAGFREAVVESFNVNVAKSVRVDIVLQVGETTQRVVVTAGAVELQTQDSSVGEVVENESLERLPTIQRRVAELAFLQVGASPILGSGGYDAGGGIAGARPDQNSFTLDGIDITDPSEGGIFGQIGPGIPIPLEAIEEFRGTVTNPSASFGQVSGGQFSFTTRRGTNDLHGSGYWYYQSDAADANSWTANSLGEKRPKLIDNRVGARLGGPIIKDKTFFFGFYEGRRFPQSTEITRLVPTDSFRNGQLRFRDGTGNIVTYNLATSTLCGPTNSSACDPRGIGMSPLIAQLMSQYPEGNLPSAGDGLNTIGFTGPANSSQSDDFAMFRLDHQFSKNWRFSGGFVYSRERINDPVNQVEIDPALTGGKPFLTLGGLPNDGRVATGAIFGQLTPHLLNEFRVGWVQTGIPLGRELPRTQITSAGAPLELAQVSGGGNLLDSPGDVDGTRARPQFSRQHVFEYIDNLSWLKGRHVIQSGFNYQHLHIFNSRTDQFNVPLIPTASITADNALSIPSTERPPVCSGAQSNCLNPSDITSWDVLYAANLGLIDHVTYFSTYNGQGQLNAPQTPNIGEVNSNDLSLYSTDTFKLNRTVTLTYGLNFTFATPFTDLNGRQGLLTDLSTGKPVVAQDFLTNREKAALQGQTYNPPLGWEPLSALHRGLYPNQAKFAPRLAASWSPSFTNGLLGSLFGNQKTVLRGGYGLVYDRINAVAQVDSNLVGNQLLGQTLSLQAPVNSSGQPFRVGVDGPVPIPPPPASVTSPFIPTQPNGITFGVGPDPSYTMGHIHSIDLTLQRQINDNTLAEVGFIGRYGRQLPFGINLNQVPVNIKDMSGLSSQTFAQAFDGVATQLRSGVAPGAVTPQPWFENNLGAGGTTNLATNDSGGFINDDVGVLVSFLVDPLLTAKGKSPIVSSPFFGFIQTSHGGWSNYNALFLSLHERAAHGLSFTANYTFSHELDTAGSVQDNLGGGILTNAYNPGFDYGDGLTDRRHSFTGYGTWELPYFKHNRFLGGWYFSGIFSAYSGLPISVNEGGDVFGLSFGVESARSLTGVVPSVGVHHNVAGSNGIGTAGAPASGGTGLNLFADPAAVYNDLRPFLLSQDNRSARGLIRGLGFWNFDSSLGKKFKITERVSASFSVDAFNLFNHVIFANPSLSLLNPASFGVITQSAGNVPQGDFAGPRRLQGGLRVEF